MRSLSSFLKVFADILAIAAFGISIFLICKGFPSDDQLHFDYQGILVGIISGIFTLLVGWNIYQAVDWKNEIKRVESLRKKVEEEFNYIHNKTDYNQAMMYAFLSGSAAAVITSCGKEEQKENMLYYGVTALVSLSNFPDRIKEEESILGTMTEALIGSKDISINSKSAAEILMKCGQIKNFDQLTRAEEFKIFLENYIGLNRGM